jgi:AcrR family transcriptional regulator
VGGAHCHTLRMARTRSGIYAGKSAEERRAERRALLLEAGLELIGTAGWSATTVRGVCTRAKLTSRFFYESFGDLDALGVAVFDEIVSDATEKVLEAVEAAPEDPAAKAHAAIDTFVRTLTDDPRRGRVVFIEGMASEPLLERRLATASAFADLIAGQARASYPPPASEDPLVDITARVLTGGLAELLITWLRGGIEMERGRLIEDCVALFVTTAEGAAALANRRAAPALRKRRPSAA